MFYWGGLCLSSMLALLAEILGLVGEWHSKMFKQMHVSFFSNLISSV